MNRPHHAKQTGMGASARVLYSFPHKLGADRICTTAWYQVQGLQQAGARVTVYAGALAKAAPNDVTVRPTLARGKFRIPYRALGSLRAFALHDYIVARRLERAPGQFDIVHLWPLGALRTLHTARRLGIPTLLERPNAHTRFAYEAARRESERVGVALPAHHEHSFNGAVLEKEEREYALATRLLCPSDFVAKSFLDQGFSPAALARHQYGYDERVYWPELSARRPNAGLTMLFVGGCAPRKGLHYALEAWLKSSAHTTGRFLIAGAFVPGYAEKLSSMLAHPSVTVLGHRSDIPALMRQSDLLVLPSVEEGSALVTSEARGSGCVLLVSQAAGAMCSHGEDGMVHSVGDVSTLTRHIDLLDGDRTVLDRLRAASLRGVTALTWRAAGERLMNVYRETLETATPRSGTSAP